MNNPINLYIKTLTPVHIGAAQEKHFNKGIDFLTENGKIFFLNEKKILKSGIRLDEYINGLRKGDLSRILRKDLSIYADKIISNVSGEIGSEIKSNIKDPIKNVPIIPGSSLKGALRSILLNEAGGMIRSERNGRTNYSQPFGKIQGDPFKYIIIGDAKFNQYRYYNTKTFNLKKGRESFVGAWKHDLRNNTSESFSPRGFTFPYECIPIGDLGELRIILNRASYDLSASNNKVHQVDIIQRLLETGQSKLFSIIQNHTKKYLQKELEFFKLYNNAETDKIVKILNSLKKENERFPVLRIGQGSGFHSVTGDYQFDTHKINGVGKWNRGLYEGANSSKSRKLAFTESEDQFVFYPMGFIQLLPLDEGNKIMEQILIDKEDQKKQSIKLQEEQKKNERLEKLAEIEARKPKIILKNSFRKNKAQIIDIEILEHRIGKLFFKAYVEGFTDLVFDVNYHASINQGTVMQINARLIAKGKKLQFEGRPIEKK